MYECGFTSGSIVHTAKADLKVALLPDTITLFIDPLTVDCTLNPPTVDVNITATISHSKENFHVWGSYMGEKISNLGNKCKANSPHCSLNLYDSILISWCLFLCTAHGDQLVYSFIVPVSCKKTLNAQYVNVTFENDLKQRRSARTDIPVIYGMLIFWLVKYLVL